MPYNTDFGPLDLSMIYKYCIQVDQMLQSPDLKNQFIVHYTCLQPGKRANSALLMAAYQVLRLNRSAEEAWAYFEKLPRFLFFRDASAEGSSFELHVLDCLQALQRAKGLNWFDLDRFSLQDYEKYSQVENGGFNWIVPGKFVAFSNPASRPNQRGLTVEQFCETFLSQGIKSVIRLNNPTYDSSKFKKRGLTHYDLFFEDGSVPSADIVSRFLSISQREESIAIHCQAGLGRTATLIGCYLIRNFNFTGLEAIAWCRLGRSGSVLGPQQHFLCDYYEGISGLEGRSLCLTPYEKHKAEFGDLDQGARLTSHSIRESQEVKAAGYKTKFNQLVGIDPMLLKLYRKK